MSEIIRPLQSPALVAEFASNIRLPPLMGCGGGYSNKSLPNPVACIILNTFISPLLLEAKQPELMPQCSEALQKKLNIMLDEQTKATRQELHVIASLTR